MLTDLMVALIQDSLRRLDGQGYLGLYLSPQEGDQAIYMYKNIENIKLLKVKHVIIKNLKSDGC